MPNNMSDCFYTLIDWGGEVTGVVWSDEQAKERLLERLRKVNDVAELEVFELELLRPGRERLVDGWARAVSRLGAVLATGLSAL